MSDIEDSSVYKTLLESTKAIPWQMDWITKEFTYIGPQIEELLGWSQASWKTAQDWIDRIHPKFRERIVGYCVAQSEHGVDHEADYPALKADGSHAWIREVVHVVREDGVTTKLIGFMFDISERKKMEDELVHVNKELERYSFQDGLTGVANRRLFDRTLESEWGRAQRNHQPLSLVVVDIDYFKQYNDFYGHIQGDDCLIRISQALNEVSSRAADLFARYGGEEFVLLLPETSKEAALEMAEKCRRAVQTLKVPHEAPGIADIVTVSVGVSTVIPAADAEPASLISAADKMLYQAKGNGRNYVAQC